MEFTKPKNIFIVDDDPMLCEAFSDYLTRKVAHVVHSFNTGEDCLKHIDEFNPDVVVLDFHLNSVQKDAADGIQILQVIKKNYPHVHVIMLSSQERYSTAMQTIQKGAEQYVIKDEDAFTKVEEIINSIG